MRRSRTRLAPIPIPPARAVVSWLAVMACVALLAGVLVSVVRQIINPPPAPRLVLVRDVPLPGALGAASDGAKDPLAPGVTVQFDQFDFQALDPQTHLLFVAHTGPNPRKMDREHIAYDLATDGHIILFDTTRQRIVGRVDIPHVIGLAIAGDLHKVFAADAYDNTVFAIDENTLTFTPIPVGDHENPDAVSYDARDHLIFVSDRGVSANPDKTANVDRGNQNLVVIDARSDHVIAKINIGNLPKLAGEQAPTAAGSQIPLFGYDLGHNMYDSARRRVFVTTQILPDADSPNPNNLPPLGTGELVEIDPIAARVVQRTQLPATCVTPHGIALDTVQEVAFIACIALDPARDIAPNLVRVDLRTMRVIPADPQAMRLAPTPDIVVLDHSAQVLLVGCKGGISLFDERAGAFHKLGDYQMSANTHSIALDETTQYVYLPINVGGRPVLRVARYNPTGA